MVPVQVAYVCRGYVSSLNKTYCCVTNSLKMTGIFLLFFSVHSELPYVHVSDEGIGKNHHDWSIVLDKQDLIRLEDYRF